MYAMIVGKLLVERKWLLGFAMLYPAYESDCPFTPCNPLLQIPLQHLAAQFPSDEAGLRFLSRVGWIIKPNDK